MHRRTHVAGVDGVSPSSRSPRHRSESHGRARPCWRRRGPRSRSGSTAASELIESRTPFVAFSHGISAEVRTSGPPMLVRHTCWRSATSTSASGRIGSGPRVLALWTSRSRRPYVVTSASSRSRWSVSVRSPTSAVTPSGRSASLSFSPLRPSVITRQPVLRERLAQGQAQPGRSPGDERHPICRLGRHETMVQVQVNLSSRGEPWILAIYFRWARSPGAVASPLRRSATTSPRD